MSITISTFTPDEHEEAITLWKSCEGIGLNNADSKSCIESFLQRNPNMSFVDYDNELLVGAVLCGSNGRRGYIYHIAIQPDYRKQNVGRLLIDNCTRTLKAIGIQKCHLFTYNKNSDGQDFWRKTGWDCRSDINVFSKDLT